MCLRVLLAFGTGFLIGWERECHGRPAGLRTNILVCVASAVAMIVSEMLLLKSGAISTSGAVRADPARLGAGILTGIGFLGAGTILRHENFVRGITTAASLWFMAVLGLAFGAGFFAVGGIGLGIALVTLFLLPRLEKYIDSDWYSTLTVTGTFDALSESVLRQRLEALGPVVLALKSSYDVEHKQKTFTCDLKLKRRERFDLSTSIAANIGQYPGVLRVQWE